MRLTREIQRRFDEGDLMIWIEGQTSRWMRDTRVFRFNESKLDGDCIIVIKCQNKRECGEVAISCLFKV